MHVVKIVGGPKQANPLNLTSETVTCHLEYPFKTFLKGKGLHVFKDTSTTNGQNYRVVNEKVVTEAIGRHLILWQV